MSKLDCICGYTIRDQADSLPYKASLLRDIDHASFFDWLVEETQGYVEAAQGGSVDSWLLEKGYGADYVALKLPHGHILHDHIRARYLEYQRDVYQCTNCSRVHIESSQPSMFASYSSDDPAAKGPFCEDS